METRRRTLQYKIAKFLSGTGNLEQKLQAAIAKLNDVKQREEPLTEHGASFRLLSGVMSRHGIECGRMLLYTPGQRQSLLELDAEAKDYVLSTISAPAGAQKAKREFVESMLYFGVKGNHVMILGSIALSAKAFETHLNWLLAQASQIKAGEDGVALANQPSAAAKEAVKGKSVKSIKFGSHLNFGVQPAAGGSREVTAGGSKEVTVTDSVEPTGDAANALTAMLGDWFGGHKLKDALEQANIRVTVTVSYVSHTKSESGYEVMEQLAIAGRHYDERDTVIKLDGGGQIKGEDLKVSTPFDVKIDKDGMVVEADLWADMSRWLKAAVGDGLVPAQ